MRLLVHRYDERQSFSLNGAEELNISPTSIATSDTATSLSSSTSSLHEEMASCLSHQEEYNNHDYPKKRRSLLRLSSMSARAAEKGERKTKRRYSRLRMSKSNKKSMKSHEKSLHKNRKVLNQHLRELSHFFARQLSLNADGICYFPFNDKFIVVIEVPDDYEQHYGGYFVYIYTMVYRIDPECDNLNKVMQTAMCLNYMQIGSHGATIGMVGNEINLCFSVPITGLRHDDFKKYVSDYMRATIEINKQLENAAAAVAK